MPEPGGPFPGCTTQHSLPEPDCDNDAQGVLTVVKRSSGHVCERLICQPCVEREIRGWKMQPDGAWWTLIYHSFKDLVEQEEKLMPDVFGSPRQGVINVNYSCRPTTITFASSPAVGSCQLRSADGLGLL